MVEELQGAKSAAGPALTDASPARGFAPRAVARRGLDDALARVAGGSSMEVDWDEGQLAEL